MPRLNLDFHEVIIDVTGMLQKPDFRSKNSQSLKIYTVLRYQYEEHSKLIILTFQ